MSYRPSAVAPKGPWGRFLDQQRREKGWSAQQAFEALRVGLGLGPKSRASYVALEAGRLPTPKQRAFLVSYFGKGPDESPEPAGATETPEALVRALYAQTEAINALVARLDSLASGAIRDGVTDALREAGVIPAGAASLDARPPEQFA